MEQVEKIYINRQLAFYSKKGAIQFNLKKDKDGKTMFLLEAANAIANTDHQYAFQTDKIIISLGIPDIGTILNAIRVNFDPNKPGSKVNIYHDPGKGSSTEGNISKGLAFTKGEIYKENQTYMININQRVKQANGEFKNTNIVVPITDAQLCVLRIALEKALLYLINYEDLL